jgi:hypothetical protein
MPFRRAEDRIRELCHQVVIADDATFVGALSELRSALREHVEHLRRMTVNQLAGEQERRNRSLGD